MAHFTVTFREDKCKGCELCISVCPKNILMLRETINQKGYHPAGITDPDSCVGCCSCALSCPDGAIRIDSE